ncbi:hypothetical protein KFU94_33410 [Chloroflexi bacterium TSY]|nr:hypothetical protein [Chloroflexi bacterium TSY]
MTPKSLQSRLKIAKNAKFGSTEAFKGPLWDQNGVEVRYEILMNREEYDYIVDNKLYNFTFW